MSLTILITGAAGEVGHALVPALAQMGNCKVVATGLALSHNQPLLRLDDQSNSQFSLDQFTLDVTNRPALDKLFERYDFDIIFHLAGVLSSHGERDPVRAHEVNVNGSFNLLSAAHAHAAARAKPVVFVFPSTMAVYGILSPGEKVQLGRVGEDQGLHPITMYGINKLYVENLGSYFTHHYGALISAERWIDFRAVRFPGLLSAETVPTGGTSDYAPEMIHHAVQGKPYHCFVRPESRLPFLAMPDAARCLVELMSTPRSRLSRDVYNVSSFSASAEELRNDVLAHFPTASIGYEINPARLAVVESWPADLDDGAARQDWSWKPRYDRASIFTEYLIPRISARYCG